MTTTKKNGNKNRGTKSSRSTSNGKKTAIAEEIEAGVIAGMQDATAAAAPPPKVDVKETLTQAIGGLLEEYQGNRQRQQEIVAEQERIEQTLVEQFSIEEGIFAGASRTPNRFQAPARQPAARRPGRPSNQGGQPGNQNARGNRGNQTSNRGQGNRGGNQGNRRQGGQTGNQNARGNRGNQTGNRGQGNRGGATRIAASPRGKANGMSRQDLVAQWFLSQPNKTGMAGDLKAFFGKKGISINTAIVMLTRMTDKGLLKQTGKRGEYRYTGRAPRQAA